MLHRYRVAVVQLNSGEDKSANLAQAGVLLARAAATGAALIVLPEMFNGFGRWETMTAAAEPIPGPTHDWLAEQARRHRVWLVGGSITEREPGESRCHNTSLLFDPTDAWRVSIARFICSTQMCRANRPRANRIGWLVAASRRRPTRRWTVVASDLLRSAILGALRALRDRRERVDRRSRRVHGHDRPRSLGSIAPCASD